ncbi:hypothetical protein ACC705_34210, partial [Rhizobium ruizarguesonis]
GRATREVEEVERRGRGGVPSPRERGEREEKGLTYLLVSHDLAVIAHMCDRVLIMKNGCFVDELTKADLQAGTTHDAYARELFEASFIEA